MKKICKLCGKEFDAVGKGRRSICNGVHYNTCVVCGQQFEVDHSTYTRVTCSDECNRKRNSEAAKLRMANHSTKKTNSNSKGKYSRNCIICGELFHTDSDNRYTCYNDHVCKCEICGTEYHVGPQGNYRRTCGYKCAAELRARELEAKCGVRSTFQLPGVAERIKQTNIERYGVENPLSSSEIREQIKATCLERYGVEFATQSAEMQSKSRKTCLERFGTEIAAQSEVVKERTRKTNIERYGVDNIQKSPDFREHVKQLNQARYGVDYYTETDEFHQKQTATWREKYGGNPWSSSEIRDKCNQTSLEIYGNIWPQCTDEIKQRQKETFIRHRAELIQDDEIRQNYLDFKRDPQKYIEDQHNQGLGIDDISASLGYSDSTLIYDFIHDNGLENLLRWSGMSKIEQDVVDFISSLDSTIEVTVHNRSIINPKELDIYLPQYRIGIECNPTITHNSTFVLGNALGAKSYNVTPPDYHAMKTNMCIDKDVFLFHIFGYEWKNRHEIILSMIRNLLGMNKIKYYARKLKVKEVPYSDCTEFLEKNHRQGSAASSIRLGLYTDEGELVSVMTFGHIRSTIGRNKDTSEDTVELVRFCNLINTSVVGGASKLFNYYLKNYHPTKVVSFSDKAHTRGNLYENLGFHKVSEAKPNYVWVNLNTNFYLNRVSCQKRNLPKLFGEPDLDIENQTEQQIMSSKGFVQVFDSGSIRWEYDCN